MENLKIAQFISNNSGYGYEDGYDDGSGDDYGDGSGYGYVYGFGFGYGDGSGYNNGYGYGLGYGNGSGDSDGCGCGDGCGEGIKKYNQFEIHLIDEIQTILTSICGNLAKGYILKEDLTLSPCFIAKGNGYFAHGETAKEAREALEKKIFSNMDTEEVIAEKMKYNEGRPYRHGKKY